MIKKVSKTPDVIFIVPYRNRLQHKKIFECVMPTIITEPNYRIFFIHQKDNRSFNRGAMKNLGFYKIKLIYPLDYKDITIVFHDIDIMPMYKNQFNYKTKPNVVKHFYGFTQTLGGIISITAGDFEKINGFPNIWTWGLEDNIIKKRCLVNGYTIDRSQFIPYHLGDKKLIKLDHGWDRSIDLKIGKKYFINNFNDGISSLKQIKIDSEIDSEIFAMFNITYFITDEDEQSATNKANILDSRIHNKFYNQKSKKKSANKAILQFNILKHQPKLKSNSKINTRPKTNPTHIRFM
jgi:hypothetical protein